MRASRITAGFLAWRNRQHSSIRASLGKVADIKDVSLEKQTHWNPSEAGAGGNIASNNQAFHDLTDTQNEDFIYVL